jgi:tetratricopeptide (TPR) repeat protein/transcriptional regulator with XRE-family HTH domain
MDDTTLSTFGELLKAFRKQRKITQQVLATQLGVHRNTIGTWENGEFLPDSKAIVLELARLLHLDTQNTRRLLEASLTALSPHWQVPYQRNPFFTGRDSILQQLHDTLAHEHSATISQSYALSGLGGIGKTQTAIEYAYRYANDYAAVFWISAETNESIVSSFVAVAELLNLPEKQDKEQSRVITAVTRWLTSHSDWLLIFDNVENIELVKSVLPPARCGSLLFTSRRQALEFSAYVLDLERMTSEEGMRFLLHRARLLAPTASLASLAPEDREIAREIVTAMDGLPLALDQAGAYIEANQLSLAEYLELFQSSQMRLLDERDSHSDHPSSVTRTFALAFEQLERNNPAAAELLTICAFLAPEAIPETFFIDGAKHLGPSFEKLAADPFAFRTAIKALLTYSLIQRNATPKTVTIHRLVQVVLKERLSEAGQHIWITRVIRAMTQLFPSEKVQTNYWLICEQLLSHAMMCITISDQWPEDIHKPTKLMSNIAIYLSYRAHFSEADSLFKKALHIRQHTSGPDHPLVAEVLYEMAYLNFSQGLYQQAEALFQRALHIRERAMGSEHPLVAEVLNRLAILYWQTGKYEQAEVLYQRTLLIRERALGSDHPKVASSLNNLAIVYKEQGLYEEAIPLFQQALRIWERSQVSNHPEAAYPLNNLADIYKEQGLYEEAIPLFQRALHIREQVIGPDHPLVAMPLNNLADIYKEQGLHEEAKLFYERALYIWEQGLGPDHPDIAYALNGLANLYREQSLYELARPLYQRVLTLRQSLQHFDVADSLHDIAYFHELQHQTIEALSLYQQALTIREKALGPHHPKTNVTRTAYVQLLRELGRVEEALIIENQTSESVIEA